MTRIIAPLEMMGAKVAAPERRRPPLQVAGEKIERPSLTRQPVAKRQVKSCLLFAGLFRWENISRRTGAHRDMENSRCAPSRRKSRSRERIANQGQARKLHAD